MGIRIAVHAHMGFRPWLARCTGLDGKFGLARSFVNADERSKSRSGRTGDLAWELVEEGLYQLGGTKHDNETFVVWFRPDGSLAKTIIDVARAKEIARRLDAGMDFEGARLATKPAPKQAS